MEKIQSGNELYEHLGKMSKKNSMTQVYIPGKGIFRILLQEEDPSSILCEAESDSQLRQMIKDSRVAYENGDRVTTEQFVASISSTEFAK